MSELPIVDIEALRNPSAHRQEVGQAVRALRQACRTFGFFYVTGHGIDQRLIDALHRTSQEFFTLPEQTKRRIDMQRGGRDWRGYFGVGDELTSGKPDWKEGLYFGAELGPEHPFVQAGTPMHGANLFPEEVPEMRDIVLRYLDALTELGHVLLRGLALGLGLDSDAFRQELTADPLVLFRIFHYPEMGREQIEEALWSVGEHTDYGLLTILLQDNVGGLEVKSLDQQRWIAAPPVEHSFVCNLGDMLERITGGFYRSTPHRVLNRSGRSRFSFPFFFDPGWQAEIRPFDPSSKAIDDSEERWDGRSVHSFSGTYGDYLLQKVGRVFPDLAKGVTPGNR